MTTELYYVALGLLAFGTVYWWVRFARAQGRYEADEFVIDELRRVNAELSADYIRMNWLEEQQRKNPDLGGVIFRWSTHGRGWRLHQTTRVDAFKTVRRAIDSGRFYDKRPAVAPPGEETL